MRHFDHLVYLRVHEGCNIVCRHCFIPANAKRMSLDQIAKVPDLVASFAVPGQVIRLQWHGGEPTLVGHSWMRTAIQTIENDKRFIWNHDIQTNLMNYSPEWRDLYLEKFGARIGVSWDIGLRFWKGDEEAYQRIFRRNLAQLIADGIHPCLTVTATKLLFRHYRNPMSFLMKLEEMGINEAHIERITKTGRAIDEWERIGLNNAEYSQNMIRLARAYIAYRRNGGKVNLSPFDDLLNALSAGARGSGCWSGLCYSRFHTIDANGYAPGCTAITANANPNAETLIDRAKTFVVSFYDMQDENNRRKSNCGCCDFAPMCSSSCLTIPLTDGSGECSGAKSLLTFLRGAAPVIIGGMT